jgi:hypothetical protein
MAFFLNPVRQGIDHSSFARAQYDLLRQKQKGGAGFVKFF